MISQKTVELAPLGTLQNNSNPLELGGVLPNDKTIKEVNRLTRWALQEQIRKILSHKHRINYCMRRTITKDGSVKLMYSPSVERAHYKNLMTCSNVWVCPICNSKIMTRRSLELKMRINQNGYTLYMVTFTIQHNKKDRLTVLLKDMSSGIAYLRKNKKYWDKLKKDLDIVGTITGLEVRYSRFTGWHPHKHVLYVSKNPDLNKSELKRRIIKRYGAYLERLGYVVNKHTVDVIKTTATDYINKWGIETELTGGMMKKGTNSFNPFQLVMMGMYDEFREYVKSMKGQRSLVYSRGLKKILNIEELTDSEINQYQNEDSIDMINIKRKYWLLICDNNLRGQLLEVASSGEIEKVISYLQSYSIDLTE